jgi:glycosyltransferase involved in cell wall biosynthesis
METLDRATKRELEVPTATLAVSVIIATKNEAGNLPRCLESLRGAGEVFVVDSQSGDDTAEIARSYGAQIVQFYYSGGWPKKRQWAMDTLSLSYDWILLLDADESLTVDLMAEIRLAIQDPEYDGFYIGLRMHFLGRALKHGGAGFYKLALFRRGRGRFECRLRNQDSSMCDMEVHEHVVVQGKTRRLKNFVLHRNVESLSRSIQKHNEYSNWESHVWVNGESGFSDLPPALFGSQAQRRRWLKKTFLAVPGSPVLFFLYRYLFRLGFLDGVPGLIYCTMQGIQIFHVKAKMFELRVERSANKQELIGEEACGPAS